MTRSREYDRAVAEAQAHHADSKTYSGRLLRPHKAYLTALIERLGIQSALDYGCGKGEQYRWIDHVDGKRLEELWGFEVAKFDPAFPPYAAEPEGKYDLVICSHTLSIIPQADLDWVTRRLFEHAGRAVFIAEKIGGRKKRVDNPDGRAIGWESARWLNHVGSIAQEFPEILAVLSVREDLPRGRVTTRHSWQGGIYLGGEEATPRED